ncbi:MAG TPA: hypothetical protein GX709_01605 [Clostridiales bacterium]|nr:hypothetical protein [Clostridiales bacterium]
MNIARTINLKDLKNKYENFTLSKYYNASIFLIICMCYLFAREDIGFLILVIAIISNWILIDDMLPMILPLFGCCIIVLRLYNGWEKLVDFWPLLIWACVALVFHIVYYRKEIKKSKLLLPLLATTVALFLGGVTNISAKDYFSFNSIYYILGLGPLMLIFYFLFRHHLNPNRKYNTFDAIVDIANTIGGIVIVMLVIQYVQNIFLPIKALGDMEKESAAVSKIINTHLQFGNNLSTVLLMVMPFAFYKAKKTKWLNYAYTTLGSLECLAMIFTMSRSGILFSMMFIIFYMIYLFKDNKIRDKFKNILTFTLPLIITLIILIVKRGYWKLIFKIAFNNMSLLQEEALVLLFAVVIIGIGLYAYIDLIHKNPKKRSNILMITEIVIISFIAILVLFWKYLFGALSQLGEARVEMANIAVQNLFKHPLFGTGMGYTGMHDIYKPHGLMLNSYHCVVLQIIGSMGMVGILAYGYAFHKKYELLFKVDDKKFSYFILPIIGLHAMSIINPGIMMPLPYAMFEILILAVAENYLDRKAAKFI